MKFTTFNEIVNKTKIELPILFGLEHDIIPSQEDISKFEEQHNIQLTEKYKQVLLKYGGELSDTQIYTPWIRAVVFIF